MSEEIFLIDANSLITPHLTFYPFDFAPGFWSQLEQSIQDGRIAILDMVKAEILHGNDNLKELSEWSRESVADPWLIAAAATYNTIITFEEANKGLNSRSPSKNAKIPDVANEFGVKTEKLYYMMRELGLKLR